MKQPSIRFLTEELIERIVAEAIYLLDTLGVEIHNPQAVDLLASHGARISPDRFRVYLSEDLVRRAISSAPRSFRLFDVLGNQTHDFTPDAVYFTPASAALYFLDYPSGQVRRPTTEDYIRYVRLVEQLQHIASQSTAMVPADVPAEISDAYRLFLSLLYGRKPVVTGAFSAEGFGLMRDLQLMVRGSQEELEAKPLTIFSACPTSPLRWSYGPSQNLLDCARHGIPVELIAMPLSGFQAPVSLVGTLIQHTAETLSGLVLSQLARPGAPVLYGGSPAIFDVRYETTPMGAMETMMLDCAYCEIGKFLGLPTQAYIGMSDAKQLDAQAGLESGIGAVLAVLARINNVSGPGMLDFENCQSLEKLLLDNEICGMAFRLAAGIQPREDFPALPLFEELLRERHLLIADHTRRWLKEEIYFPGPVIDRTRRQRWEQQGSPSLLDRAHREVQRLIQSAPPSPLADHIRRDLIARMEAEAHRYGLAKLPLRPAADT
ncbi:MAG: trimethylamine methyltransferase family protein [Thermoguttaceae bacterium]|nr:trimethylamine methyltransferase family protein [Thermoguttaceae bacterium]MDW8039679.1 trimethylamine methyltransferase family protein [Thermoguttaceae bacterium]